MSVVDSTYEVGPAQIDGRKYVLEKHTDSEGVVHVVQYLAAVGADYTSIMTARAALISTQLADEEAAKLLGT